MGAGEKQAEKRGADGRDGAPARRAARADKGRKNARFTKEERQKQIAEVTLKLVAKHGVHGATISRIASGVGLSRAALYKCFPNREAMLEAALDLLVERVPRWIARSSGATVYEHLMDMGNQFGPLGISEFETLHSSLVPVRGGERHREADPGAGQEAPGLHSGLRRPRRARKT